MTIDERLDRLTGRHEALSQTVELMSHQIHATSKIVDRLGVKIDALVESVKDLVRVARMHENRTTGLEEQC